MACAIRATPHAPHGPPRKSALERHAAFFDPEGTGIVTVGQTWDGLARLGVGVGWRLVLSPIIHGFLGYLTQRKLSLDVVIARIKDGKHPFDTGVFGDDGDIDEAAFDALVAAAGEGFTAKEMNALIRGRGNRRTEMGKLAGALGRWFSAREVELLVCLAADARKTEDGREAPAVTPRTLRRFYEGKLLSALARRQRIRAARIARAVPTPAASGFLHRMVDVGEVRFHVAEARPAGCNGSPDVPQNVPLVVLLHGFPEFWWSWRHQLRCAGVHLDFLWSGSGPG
ncbi:MAG: hypothetical protein A2V77_18960 [Anaeromyxobacter sp. RBG_16_69_14]|nr:MAG: hypothetical protein A2V77_18960 [Anaeromyxobacter sp. RBG_16_69_14]